MRSTDGGGSRGSGTKKKKLGASDWTTEKSVPSSAKTSGSSKKSRWAGMLAKDLKVPTEANDKVWALNRHTGSALETLAILCQRFEQVNSDLANVEREEALQGV